MITTRMMPSRQVMQDGVRREMHQIAAVDEWNDLNALGQNVVVQLLDFLVDSLHVESASAPFRSSTMPETTSSLSMILPSSL